ncbi:MFS monocarboxylate transporter [Colletotrichum tofieldiae]|nr:MFS monocarboxylate transporter [Colletotrichum tofieldiae]
MSVELRRLPNADADASAPQSDEEDVHTLVQTMPPTDKGAAAWKFLLSSFVIEALLWGILELVARPQFENDPNIATIGTLSTSIYFLGAPLAAPLVKRFHLYQRHMVVVGWALCVASLVGASFADSIPGLIATQGVLYGFGFLMLYFPVLRMLNEWFIARRGLAYGVLLANYGHRTTLRAVAFAQFVCVAPVLHMIKGRLPPSPHGAMRMFDVSFLRQPLFYCFALSNLFQGFAYYIPSLYLPSYASSIGLSGTMGALILAAHNLATVFGQLGFGWLSDRTDNVFALIFMSSFVSSVAAFTLWGFAHSLALLIVFALVFGMFAGGFLIFWAKFGAMLSDDPQPVFSMMAFGKGIGNLATGPITAGLLTKPVSWSYGMGRYESLILFLGSFMLCSSLGALAWPLKKR